MDADIGVNAKVVYSLLNGTEYFKIENETGTLLKVFKPSCPTADKRSMTVFVTVFAFHRAHRCTFSSKTVRQINPAFLTNLFFLKCVIPGVISTIVELDREKIPSFTVLVFAKDLGTPSRNATTSLTVTVLDANDNAPLLNDTLYANVIEEQPKGQFVIQLVATDADDGANAMIEYDLEANAKQFLNISTKNGNVTTLVPFDFEAQRNYTFKVIVSDKGMGKYGTKLCVLLQL